MLREHHLEYCTVCTNKRFDRAKGVVCGLTGEHADFGTECKDFEKDEKAFEDRERKRAQEAKDELKDQTGGLSSIGIKNPVVAGIILVVLTAAGNITLWIYGFVSLYAILVFIIAVVILIKGMIKRNQTIKKKKSNAFEGIIDRD